MKTEFTIKVYQWEDVAVSLNGYPPLVEKLAEAIKVAAREFNDSMEIK
uniref:Uncharacterized protein n=1 Tax=viral metagenome TaxID=1070528 RepID=A0A6M3IR44_9ZZZZ